MRLDRVLAFAQNLLIFRCCLIHLENISTYQRFLILVRGCNTQGRQGKVISQLDEHPAPLDIFESNAPQILVVMLCSVKPVVQYRLIANNSGRWVDWCRTNSASIHIGFGARHKESTRLMQSIEMCEIQMSAILDIERTRLDRHEVQNVDFVHLDVADVVKRWDWAPQVQQGVQLDRTLDLAKRSQVEQAHRQIDRGRVQCVASVLQAESDQICVVIDLARATNQQRCDIRPNALIARLVGIGQRRAMNAVSHTHRSEFFALALSVTSMSRRLSCYFSCANPNHETPPCRSCDEHPCCRRSNRRGDQSSSTARTQ